MRAHLAKVQFVENKLDDKFEGKEGKKKPDDQLFHGNRHRMLKETNGCGAGKDLSGG